MNLQRKQVVDVACKELPMKGNHGTITNPISNARSQQRVDLYRKGLWILPLQAYR